jgi:hypothetical protein
LCDRTVGRLKIVAQGRELGCAEEGDWPRVCTDGGGWRQIKESEGEGGGGWVVFWVGGEVVVVKGMGVCVGLTFGSHGSVILAGNP